MQCPQLESCGVSDKSLDYAPVTAPKSEWNVVEPFDWKEDLKRFIRSVGANPPRSAVDFLEDVSSPVGHNYTAGDAGNSVDFNHGESSEVQHIILKPRPKPENGFQQVVPIKLSRQELCELCHKYDLRNAARWLVRISLYEPSRAQMKSKQIFFCIPQDSQREER